MEESTACCPVGALLADRLSDPSLWAICDCYNVEFRQSPARTSNPPDELRRLDAPILTTAEVAEMMHYTIGDVRDKVNRSGFVGDCLV